MKMVLTALVGVEVKSPGDWETPSAALPEVKVRTPANRKTSVTRGPSGYVSTVSVEILARARGNTAEEAQDAIDELGILVENAVMSAPSIIEWLQQIASVSSETTITATGRDHLAEMRWTVDCETYETFERIDIAPEEFQALQQLVLNIDTIRPFDPGLTAASIAAGVNADVTAALTVPSTVQAGNYPSPLHPETVLPAPRTSGRDGRLEGVLDLTLSN